MFPFALTVLVTAVHGLHAVRYFILKAVQTIPRALSGVRLKKASVLHL